MRAVNYLWQSRHRTSDLVGTVINIHNGDWVRRGTYTVWCSLCLWFLSCCRSIFVYTGDVQSRISVACEPHPACGVQGKTPENLSYEHLKDERGISLFSKPILEQRCINLPYGIAQRTCYLIQMNMFHLNPSQAGQYQHSQKYQRLRWPRCWLYSEMFYLSTESHPSR